MNDKLFKLQIDFFFFLINPEYKYKKYKSPWQDAVE